MPTVAEQLRAAREANKLTIEQFAEATKIRTDHLRALEQGNYNVFSAPIYIRGSVKNCAMRLKLDVPRIMADLDRELKGTENFSEPPPLMDQTKSPVDHMMYYLSKLNWKFGAAAAIVGGVILVFILARSGIHHLRNHGHAPNLPPAVYRPQDSDETLPLHH